MTHSPAFDILGQAGNPASVTVTTDISGTTTEQVDQSPWWRQRLTHTSSSSPRWGEATVSHALASRTGDYYLPPGTETLSYDADGNLSGDARWTYTWDNQNRLIKMETKSAVITAGAPNDVLEFTYDGVNRRVRKKFIRNGSTVYDEYYLYDGWNITGRFRGSSVTKTLIQKYAWGLDASGTLHGAGGVGGLLWVEDAATTTTRWFPAYDGNGNVMALLEDNANSATAGYLNLFHEYGPFGESLSKRGVMDSFGHNCPFQFSTKWTDEETGLIYYGHRYYDPKHGRWLSRDPIGEAGGVNLYGFVGNDGVNRWDYLGQKAKVETKVDNSGKYPVVTVDITVNVYWHCGEPHLSLKRQKKLTRFAAKIWNFKSKRKKKKGGFLGLFKPTLVSYIVKTKINARYEDAGDKKEKPYSENEIFVQKKGGTSSVTSFGGRGKKNTRTEMKFTKPWRELTFAHEIGHVIGHRDMYWDNGEKGKDRRTETLEGWGGNLMSDREPFLDWKNAEEILHLHNITVPDVNFEVPPKFNKKNPPKGVFK